MRDWECSKDNCRKGKRAKRSGRIQIGGEGGGEQNRESGNVGNPRGRECQEREE